MCRSDINTLVDYTIQAEKCHSHNSTFHVRDLFNPGFWKSLRGYERMMIGRGYNVKSTRTSTFQDFDKDHVATYRS